MFFIISPFKNMKLSVDRNFNLTIRNNINKTKELIYYLNKLSIEEVKKAMKISEKVAILNKDRYNNFKFDVLGYPAIYLYDGLQYKNIGLFDFNNSDIDFLIKNVRIISALYGVLNPLDSIYPYRLDMNTKFVLNEYNNLYEYWGSSIYNQLYYSTDNLIVDLSSNEYSKIIYKYINIYDKYLKLNFKVNKLGVLKSFSTYSKIARGKMLNY